MSTINDTRGGAGAPPGDVFYCPACGQKHRADLTPIRSGKSAVLRAPCARCGKALGVEWKGEKPVVRIVDAVRPAPPAPKAPVAAARTSPAAPPAEDAAPPSAAKVAEAAASDPSPPAAAPASSASASWEPPAPKIAMPSASPAAPPQRTETPPPLLTKKERAAKEVKKGDDAEKDAEHPQIVGEFPKGTQVDRYVLGEAIGEGGTGMVYRAFDATTNRYVALKILAKGTSDTMRERFLREIEVQANLRHPNIMPVFDRGEFEGRPYFTMELLYRPFTLSQIVDMAQGGTLSRYTTLRPFEDPRILVRDVLIPVCEALYVANVENGVVHRDLKPDNVLVDSRTLRPYVIDFGICHVLERRERFSATVLAPTAEDAGIVGTPRYLAPEQARGAVHERTDVWGLGALLQYLYSGEPPVSASANITRAELKRRIEALRAAQEGARAAGDEKKADLCAEKLARLEDQGLRTLDDLFQDARNGVYSAPSSVMPGTLVAISRKALAPKTADRYVNARQMTGDLNAWLKGTRVLAHVEQGSAAGVAVESAKRAVKRHLVTAVLVLAGAGLGFLSAWALKGGRGAAAVASLEVVSDELNALEGDARRIGEHASAMSAKEGAHVYDVLAGRLDLLERRIVAASGSASDKQAAHDRAAWVGHRFGPSRFLLRAPKGVRASLEDVLRGGKTEVVSAGEVPVKPGEYRISVKEKDQEKFRAPLRVFFAFRDPAQGPGSDREAAVATIEIPKDPALVPDRMVLVAGATVLHRGPPFSEPPPVPADVKTFQIDQFEVPNRSWTQFLESIADDAERARRVPAAAFQPKPDDAKRFQTVAGSEDLPVVGVTPDDVLAYCAWRSKKEGATVRLPNEAEWVLVAGGTFPEYVLPGGAQGNPSDFAPPMKPVESRALDLSPFGVLGLLANAREMVTPYREGAGTEVLVKGGAAGDEPYEAAIRRLRRLPRDGRDDRTGFRCVCEIGAP